LDKIPASGKLRDQAVMSVVSSQLQISWIDLSPLLTITFDTSIDCVFLYSLFPASFLYTLLSLEDKKFLVFHGRSSAMMLESLAEITHTTQTEAIHLPKDGRALEVEVQHLVKTFGKHEAVKDLSLTIGKGEIFGLLGPNGAGKSTSINMMCDYLEPTSGDTLIAGHSITREPRRVKRMVGVVPQEIAL
jgi:ABC-type multidrug transport system fused ATPase/permease subunit